MVLMAGLEDNETFIEIVFRESNFIFGARALEADSEWYYWPAMELCYSILISITLANLVIAILGDAYEIVTSENKYYDACTKLNRSLMYERLRRTFCCLTR